jgi:hypothetical protein
MEEMERGVPGLKMRDWIGKLFAETCDQIHGACEVK